MILPSEFNIDLIKAKSNDNGSEFLYVIYSGYLVPHITSLTRLTSKSHNLIDNIMSNVITE